LLFFHPPPLLLQYISTVVLQCESGITGYLAGGGIVGPTQSAARILSSPARDLTCLYLTDSRA